MQQQQAPQQPMMQPQMPPQGALVGWGLVKMAIKYITKIIILQSPQRRRCEWCREWSVFYSNFFPIDNFFCSLLVEPNNFSAFSTTPDFSNISSRRSSRSRCMADLQPGPDCPARPRWRPACNTTAAGRLLQAPPECPCSSSSPSSRTCSRCSRNRWAMEADSAKR